MELTGGRFRGTINLRSVMVSQHQAHYTRTKTTPQRFFSRKTARKTLGKILGEPSYCPAGLLIMEKVL